MNAGRADVAAPRAPFEPGDAEASRLRPGAPPSANFDLSHWKLTLPVTADGGASGLAATIKTGELVSGYTSPYFYTARDGAMVFYAPSNGATTTPGVGSDHTRSELRELCGGAAGSPNWTNAVGGTLTAKCRVDRVSTNSDEATIGQIHGVASPFVLLEYVPTKRVVRLSMYATPTTGKGEFTTLVSDVDPRSMIDYELAWTGSALSARVNGTSMTLFTDPSWNDVPVYFKAGAYSAAPDVGNPTGDATEVSFYALRAAH